MSGLQPVADTKPDPTLGLLLGNLGGVFTERTRKALTAYVAAMAVVNAGHHWYRKAVDQVSFVVSVDSADDIYHDLHAWVLSNVPADRQRSLVARSSRSGHQDQLVAPEESQRPKPPTLRLFYDGRRSQLVTLEGHRIRVTVEQEQEFVGRESVGNRGWWKLHRILLTSNTVGGRDAVLRLLREMAAAQAEQRQVRFYVATQWGGWQRAMDMPTRPLESVVLRAGQKEDLVADLRRFLDEEQVYTRLGLPWHRGYLLTGPPGTGKTSMARALAVELELDLYFISLSSIPNDSSLAQCVAAIPPRSMLLLEDIDIVHGARKRDDSEPGVSLSGLLNCLDGVLTPHGLIKVLTTNKPDVIDPALLRPGRVDYPEQTMSWVDDDQLGRLVTYALGRPLDGAMALPPLGDRRLTPADVVNVLKLHLSGRRWDAFSELARLILSPNPPEAEEAVLDSVLS